ncbi:hypothetical protein KYTH09_01130 [Helicobacter pylori]
MFQQAYDKNEMRILDILFKIIANEIFGTRNFLSTFITKQATRSNAKHINITHDMF